MSKKRNLRESVAKMPNEADRTKHGKILDVAELLVVNVSADKKTLEKAIAIPGMPEDQKAVFQGMIDNLTDSATPSVDETISLCREFLSENEISNILYLGMTRLVSNTKDRLVNAPIRKAKAEALTENQTEPQDEPDDFPDDSDDSDE